MAAPTAANVDTVRITVELRTESVTESDWLVAMPGQLALLSGDGWSVPVSIQAISASTSDAEDWAAVMVTYGAQTRIASSFLPPADVARLLRLGLDETARMIEQGEE
jgi:hypothetical protein